MNATETTTTPAPKLTDLGREALTLLAHNRPLPGTITKRTMNSLVNQGLATQDAAAGGYWITAQGRDVIGIPTEETRTRAKAGRPSKCADCDVKLTPRRRSGNEELCTYCFEEAGNENEHQDGAPKGVHETGNPCRECGTYDPNEFWTRKPAKKVGNCRCCDEPTKGGDFLPGHDARYVGMLIEAVRKNGRPVDWALDLLVDRPRLQAKLMASVAN